MTNPTRKAIGSIIKFLGAGSLIVLGFGCSTAKLPTLGITDQNDPKKGIETLVIVGTNDIHGTLAPIPMKTREAQGIKPIPYTMGGIAMITSTIKQLRDEHGKHLIWLDAGDQFQGSVESNLQLGAPMVKWFNQNKLTASAIGNHEFDFGMDVLKKRMSEAEYPYIGSNIMDRATSRFAKLPNTLPHALVTAGNLRVGIIGLSTEETPKTTQPHHVKNYHFESLKTATLRTSNELRNLGAHIIVITAHAGLTCKVGAAPRDLMMRTPNMSQGGCDEDEIVALLQSIPAGTVDAVVSGHRHKVVHHWVAGVPVIQGAAMGRFLNVIYLPYDWAQKKVVSDETRIEGPISICEKVFKNQNNCSGDQRPPAKGRGPLVPPSLHSKILKPDADAEKIVAESLVKSAPIKHALIGVVDKPVDHTNKAESEMGNLLADAIRKASKSDISIINNGIIRSSLEHGPVTYESVFRAIPFDNAVATINVDPSELEIILRVSHSGSRGFPAVSGIQISLVHPSLKAPFDDLNGNGRFELWEVNRLLDVRLPNGAPLDRRKRYQLATLDFLVMGGDDFAWPMSKIPKDRINIDAGILARDALIQHISDIGPVNSPKNRLIQPHTPRIIFKFSKAVKNFFKNKKFRSKKSSSHQVRTKLSHE